MTDFHLDLLADELGRRELMLSCMPDFDPGHAMRLQAEAHALLYGNLDAEQTRIYEDLKAAGVLP